MRTGRACVNVLGSGPLAEQTRYGLDMGIKLPPLVRTAVDNTSPAVTGTPEAAVSAPQAISVSGIKDAIERDALVAADAAMRAAQLSKLAASQHTLAPTLGKPNPGAGVGRPPVVLLAGQGDDATQAMRVYANSLKRDGFQVYVFDDPDHALESHAEASTRLGALIDRVRAQTGAAKVDLVGYSTGGTNARAYVNLFGGADKVGRVVQVAGSNNGDPNPLDFADSGREEKKGSEFMRQLNAHPSPVPITSIFETGTDGEVTEDDARLQPDPHHQNVELPQAQAGGGSAVWSDHVQLPFDPRAYQQVVSALTQNG